MSTYQTPIPGASGYEQANLLAQRAYSNAMARLNQRRSQSLLSHGYIRDAQGHLSVDPNNEYGGFQQMLRGESLQHERLGRAQLASGWGGDSGYLADQRDQLEHAQGGEQAAFGQQFENELAGFNNEEQDAAFQRDQSLYQNELDAAQRAIDQGNFNPADYTGTDAPYPEGSEPQPGGRQARPARPRPNVHQRGRQQIIRHAARRARGRRR